MKDQKKQTDFIVPPSQRFNVDDDGRLRFITASGRVFLAKEVFERASAKKARRYEKLLFEDVCNAAIAAFAADLARLTKQLKEFEAKHSTASEAERKEEQSCEAKCRLIALTIMYWRLHREVIVPTGEPVELPGVWSTKDPLGTGWQPQGSIAQI